MEKLNVKEWIFLGALVAIGISIFLPFVSIFGASASLIEISKLIGVTNGSTIIPYCAYIVLTVAIASIGLFFWKKKVGVITALVGNILLSIPLIIFLKKTSSGLIALGGSLSYGAYLLIIGIIVTLILSILLLRDLYFRKK